MRLSADSGAFRGLKKWLGNRVWHELSFGLEAGCGRYGLANFGVTRDSCGRIGFRRAPVGKPGRRLPLGHYVPCYPCQPRFGKTDAPFIMPAAGVTAPDHSPPTDVMVSNHRS